MAEGGGVTGMSPTRVRSSAFLRAAHLYVERGWRVFPLHSPRPSTAGGGCSCGERDCANIGKHPRTRNGLKDATNREAVARAWWQKWPQANLGVVTGNVSGLIVLDIDPRHGGDLSLAHLQERHEPLPVTLTAHTGGGGEHRFFAHPGGDLLLRNRAAVDGLSGLDVRGDGGYVVAAPSLHASGARYEWRDAAIPLAPLPAWLLTLLMAPRGGSSTGESATQTTHARRPFLESDVDDHAGALFTARYWLDKYVSQAQEGNRNDTGMRLALQLRDTGLDTTAAESVMCEYARRVPGDGYSEREALATLRSIYQSPAREPARTVHANGVGNGFAQTRAIWTPASSPAHYAPFADATASWAGTEAPMSDVLEATPDSTGRSADTLADRANGTPRSRFQFMTDVEVEQLPAPEWLIHGLLPASRLAVVYGEYGSGKSFLTLGMGLAVAAGHAWMGKQVRQGSVVYIAGEGLGGLGKRIRAWKLAHHYSGSVPLHVLGVAPQLMRPDEIGELAATMSRLPQPPSLIVLDTLARSMVGGDENSQKDMGLAVAGADFLRERFNATVVLVHHKPNGGTGTSNGRTRGSSALPGAADTLIDVTKDGTLVTVSCAKQKDAAAFSRLYLEMRTYAFDEHGDESSCVLTLKDRQYGNREPANETMLRILGAHPNGIHHADWQRLAGEQGVSRSTFGYQLGVMEKAERIVNYSGLWLPAGPSPT